MQSRRQQSNSRTQTTPVRSRHQPRLVAQPAHPGGGGPIVNGTPNSNPGPVLNLSADPPTPYPLEVS